MKGKETVFYKYVFYKPQPLDHLAGLALEGE